MKIRVWPLLMILSVGLGLRPATGAAVSVSAGIQINAVGDFYAPLQPYGTWVDVASYGRCFHPTHVMAGWRPYTYGHWEYTDVGWYWVSDEPFGWATFHYGSWVDDPNYGWVWIPGIEWSPAWVTWRESDSYIGWAPCGPNLAVAAPSLFVFVQLGRFCDPIQPSNVIVNNTTVINNTRVVNNFRSESRSFDGRQHRMRVNAGPDVSRVQHATGRNLNPTPIATAVQRTSERANANRSAEQPTQQRSTTTPQQSGRERSLNNQERSATTPQRPAVQEPSGTSREKTPATREAPTPAAPRESTAPSTPREASAPSAPQQAPAPEKPQRPAIKEPSGATHEPPTPSTPEQREAPARTTPREEHRTVAPQSSEHAPVQQAPAPPSHPAPAAQAAPHGPTVEHEDRGNGNDRRHDQP